MSDLFQGGKAKTPRRVPPHGIRVSLWRPQDPAKTDPRQQVLFQSPGPNYQPEPAPGLEQLGQVTSSPEP